MARSRRGRGEGSIFQRKSDGRWVGTVSLGYRPDGKRDRRIVYGGSKKEVQEKLRILQSAHYLGELKDPSTMTVAAWLDCWLDTIVKPRCSPTTYERREQVARLHVVPLVGHMKLQQVGPMHVHGMVAALEKNGDSAWVRQSAVNVLHGAFVAARKFKLITANPLDDLPRPKPINPEMVILTEAQLRRFLDAVRPFRLGAFFATAAGTGARFGELAALQWDDIDFDVGTLSIRRTMVRTKAGVVIKPPKSKASLRTIVLPPSLLQVLGDHRRDMLAAGRIRAPVFCTKAGGYVDRGDLRQRVLLPAIRTVNESGVDPLPKFRTHDLRHSHASLLLRGGGSLKAVSRRLGHSDVAFTLRTYVHLLPDADEQLAKQFERQMA
jgi:integrase